MMTWRQISLVWFSIAIVATTATQLRAPGVPIGPGELMLLVWVLFHIAKILLVDGRVNLNPATRILICFWLPSTVLLVLGAIAAIALDVTSQSAVHDALAFVFSFLVLLVFSFSHGRPYDVRYALGATSVVTVVILSVMYVLAQRVPSIGPISFWYGARFRGWAYNPNQLSLLLSVMPFVLVDLIRLSPRRIVRFLGLFGAGVVCYLGVATGSDALIVAWVLSLVMLAFLYIIGRLSFRANLTIRVKRRFLPVLMVIIVLIIALSAFWSQILANLMQAATRMYEQGGQGETRLGLWTRAFYQLVTQSPFVGFGPGAHAPRESGIGAMEAHNTIVDWGGSTGLLGILLYIALIVWSGSAAWRSKRYLWLAAMVSLFAYSLFHYVMRQPVFWFFLVSNAVLSNVSSHCSRRKSQG